MVFLALALLWPEGVGAEGESDVRAYLLSVNRLYQDLEYERALAQLALARSLARTVEDNVTLSLYEGVILADMSRWDESAAAFKEALFLRPEVKLPVKVSPKVQQHFEAVRRRVRRELDANAVKRPKEAPQPAAPPVEAPPPSATTQRPERAAEVPRTPTSAPALPEAAPAVTAEAPGRGLRTRLLLPAVGSGVLLIAGGTTYALSRRELSRLRSNDASLATAEDAHRSASRGRTYQSLGVGLLAAGAVGLGITTALHFMGNPGEVALWVSTDGSSAFVQGRWP
jgi:tetratricopeptide (TPR) repeat protein